MKLDYAHNRYYSNAYGRFMTPDPYTNSGRLTDPQSWNRYAYTRGDPVNRIDPIGDEDCTPSEGSDFCVTGTSTGEDDGVPPDADYDPANGPGGELEFWAPLFNVLTIPNGVTLSGVAHAPIQVTNLSNSNGQAQQVQNDLRTLEQLLDNDTTGCAKWLGGATAINNVINSILSPDNPTGVAVGVANFNNPGVNAVAGTFGTNIWPPNSMQITVNLNGAFFNPTASMGNGVPATILSDTSEGQAEILIHELGHLLNVLQGNDSNGNTQSQNNQAVFQNCSKVIGAANF